MKKKGFSLIEIMVVIAILAVLTAFLFPTFARAKMSAKVSASKLNLKGFWMVLEMYRQDNDEKVDYGSVTDMGLPAPPMGFTRFLESYSKDPLFRWENHRGLSPCGITVGNEPFRGIFYFGYMNFDWPKDVLRYKDKTVILADKNCNTSDIRVDCQLCTKRSIGITLAGHILDRNNSERHFYDQPFYQ